MKQGLHLERHALLVHQDLLSCGPLPAVGSLGEWTRVREHYLRSIYPDWPDFSFASASDLLTNAAALRDADSIILWIGTGTPEQLLLAWTVQLLRAVDVDLSRLRVIQFSHEPTHGYEIVGLGILNPDQFRAHPPETPLAEGDIAEIDAAWNAVTAPAPEALLAFVRCKDSSLPFLRRSLASLLFRYPNSKTGLNRWEHELLRNVHQQGPVAARVIGHTLGHNMDDPDWVGDGYLFARLRRLADSNLTHPFLSLTGPTLSMRGSVVALTDAGARALEGGTNFVELNGIDDWIGGVHLESSKGNVWFCEGDRLVRRPGARS